MKPNKRILVLIMAAAIVVAAALYLFRQWRNGGARSIRLSGNIEMTQVDIAFKAPGKLAEVLVDEGMSVKRGMVLARLDTEQAQQQREREQAALAAAESQLRQIVTAAEYQQQSLIADLQLRRAEVQQAEARLAELVAGSRQQEIEQSRAASQEAAAEEQRAARDWERAQALYKKDDISTSQYDQFRARSQAAAATAHRARQQQALVEEGPRREQIDAARAQLDRARAALRLGEAAGLELKRRRQEIDARRAETGRARAQLAITQSQLQDMTAVSPVDGVVLTKAVEAGQVVAAGTTVLTVGDVERPWLRGYVNETDLGRVRLGARVKVTTDSFPGKVYWGRVSFLSAEAEFTPKQIQTSEERVKFVYRIKVDMPNPQRELKLNMPVDAELVLE